MIQWRFTWLYCCFFSEKSLWQRAEPSQYSILTVFIIVDKTTSEISLVFHLLCIHFAHLIFIGWWDKIDVWIRKHLKMSVKTCKISMWKTNKTKTSIKRKISSGCRRPSTSAVRSRSPPGCIWYDTAWEHLERGRQLRFAVRRFDWRQCVASLLVRRHRLGLVYLHRRLHGAATQTVSVPHSIDELSWDRQTKTRKNLNILTLFNHYHKLYSRYVIKLPQI